MASLHLCGWCMREIGSSGVCESDCDRVRSRRVNISGTITVAVDAVNYRRFGEMARVLLARGRDHVLIADDVMPVDAPRPSLLLEDVNDCAPLPAIRETRAERATKTRQAFRDYVGGLPGVRKPRGDR